MRHTIVGLDVGTTKVCTVVAQVHERGGANILGVGIQPSKGFDKGVVIHIDDAAAAIAASLADAERQSGVRIDSAFVGITGNHISSLNSSGAVAISHPTHEIDTSDIGRAANAAEAVVAPSQREVLHVIPRSYAIDGQDGVRNPVGMSGYRLEVQAHVVSGEEMAVQNLIKTVERAGIDIDDLVFQPLASSEAVLTPDEMESGVVVIDIGGGTTDLAVFAPGSIWHTGVLAVGGNNITNDLAYILHVPHTHAEQIKCQYGSALVTHDQHEQDSITIEGSATSGAQQVSRQLIQEIIHARAEQMVEMIYYEIMRSGLETLPPTGIVLTGGTALLPHIDELMREMLGVPVRIGTPIRVTGLVERVNSPMFATGVGLLRWGGRAHGTLTPSQHAGRSTPSRGSSLFERFQRWLREFLP